ncbi:hypothetical protein OpiT1DRAFT_02303 [Opitutaceae bacterium TAV1]|nr:hypothetical protein OpiT1DRAFT_02303 [Opitutaceae bacterium TAV1]
MQFRFIAFSSVVLLATVFPLTAAGLDNTGPLILTWPSQPLVAVRARLTANPHDPHYAPALAALRAEAEAALQQPPASVLDKTLTPPSGDKRDYYSFGPYWWPDPKKPDGLPWINIDGKVNPANYEGNDRVALKRLCENVRTLALAHYLEGNAACAEHAARSIRVWFLDEATRMNPNLDYAQAIPGRQRTGGVGTIDGAVLLQLIDGIVLLETRPPESSPWSAADRKDMRAWLSGYLAWYLESPVATAAGKRGANNNISTWYDVQVVQLALFLGRRDLARRTLTAARHDRLVSQVLPDGRQPRELARVAPLGYSEFGARGLATLAHQASLLDPELGHAWWHRAEPGEVVPRLRKAIEFVSPYANSQISWTPPHGKGGDQGGARADIRDLLVFASVHYTDDSFRALLGPQLSDSGYTKERWRLFITP